jgi:deoxyribose-phosphate aldolase
MTLTAGSPGTFDRALAAMIDHTNLKPDATPAAIDILCAEARTYGFASVCVNPVFVKRCAGLLAGSPVAVCTVVGFPLGASTTEVKVAETADAIKHGAKEIDMVIPIGLLKAGNTEAVRDDIECVVVEAHAGGAIVKVIIETALLTDQEKIAACTIARAAGADFVKTSTGFSTAGATTGDVALMRNTVGPSCGVKAAGGIRTRTDALAMVAAGANRIGASASITIVDPERS